MGSLVRKAEPDWEAGELQLSEAGHVWWSYPTIPADLREISFMT